MDLMLPGLPGEKVLPRIKGIPKIVMSAKADIDTKVKLLYEGAFDYITKPFVVSELLARCAVHLRMHAGAKNASEDPADPLIRAGRVALDPELMIAAVTLLALIIITCLPSNRVPGKWLILIAGIVLISFVPQVYERIGGGVMGGIRDAYFNLFMIPQEVFRLTHMPF